LKRKIITVTISVIPNWKEVNKSQFNKDEKMKLKLKLELKLKLMMMLMLRLRLIMMNNWKRIFSLHKNILMQIKQKTNERMPFHSGQSPSSFSMQMFIILSIILMIILMMTNCCISYSPIIVNAFHQWMTSSFFHIHTDSFHCKFFWHNETWNYKGYNFISN